MSKKVSADPPIGKAQPRPRLTLKELAQRIQTLEGEVKKQMEELQEFRAMKDEEMKKYYFKDRIYQLIAIVALGIAVAAFILAIVL